MKKTATIPLQSQEALWEWFIPDDLFFLSQGACTRLELQQPCIPQTMHDYLKLIPASCVSTLEVMRNGVLYGISSSHLSTVYPMGSFMVQELMLVLERDAQGKAMHVMGTYHVFSANSAYLPPVTQGNPLTTNATGYWTCTLADRMVKADARSLALMGFADGHAQSFSIDAWKARMHPDEGGDIACRHQLILEENMLGDLLLDEVRVLQADGSYANLLLRGSVLERNPAGHATVLTGTLQRVAGVERGEQQQNVDVGRLLFAINATGDGLWDWDAQTDQVYYSPRYLAMLGYTAEEFSGDLDTWKVKVHPDDYDKIVPPQADIVASPRFGDTFECTYRLRCADGSWAWILGRGYVTHRDSNGRATRLVGMHTDITNTQGERSKLETLVKNDILTGLRSRTFCDMEMTRIDSDSIRPISVIAADVNGLKLINDYMGHSEGDTLLSTAAMILRHGVRAFDCVARMGGDEFVVLMPGCPSEKGVEVLAHIEQLFADHNKNSQGMPILLSFGVSSTDDPAVSVNAVYRDADRKMLARKVSQRKVSQAQIKEWLEKELHRAISLEDNRYATC